MFYVFSLGIFDNEWININTVENIFLAHLRFSHIVTTNKIIVINNNMSTFSILSEWKYKNRRREKNASWHCHMVVRCCCHQRCLFIHKKNCIWRPNRSIWYRKKRASFEKLIEMEGNKTVKTIWEEKFDVLFLFFVLYVNQ